MANFVDSFNEGVDISRRRRREDEEERLRREEREYRDNVLRPHALKKMAREEIGWKRDDEDRQREVEVVRPRLDKKAEWDDEDRDREVNVIRPRQDNVFKRQYEEQAIRLQELKEGRDEKNINKFISGQAYVISLNSLPGENADELIKGAQMPDGSEATPEYRAKLSTRVKTFHEQRRADMEEMDEELKRDIRTIMPISLDDWGGYAKKLIDKYGHENLVNINMQPKNDQELMQTKRMLSLQAGQRSQKLNAALKSYGMSETGEPFSRKDIERANKRLTTLQELLQKAQSGQVANSSDIANLRMSGIRDINIGDPLPGADNPGWIEQIEREISYYERLLDSGSEPGPEQEQPQQFDAAGSMLSHRPTQSRRPLETFHNKKSIQ